MAYNATVYRVMIASPGDVIQERNLVRALIHEWNAVYSLDKRIVLMPVGWESHSSPLMGERPQEILNKQILSDCDLLVATFWTRIGSPTGKSPSGSVEEIEEHLAANKPTMIYFSTAPVHPDGIDEAQYTALKKFKNECKKRGLVEEYDSLSQFREKFARQLAQTVLRYFPQEEDISGNDFFDRIFNQAEVHEELSDAAKQLLKNAAKDKNGTLLRVSTRSGLSVSTNGRNFVSNQKPREQAYWEDAVFELRDKGYLKDRGYKNEVFSVTSAGYEKADLLDEQQ